ncbi:MAG TPA: TetR/AcrR family transcriptional regulator [Aggregatilineales bacterium]|nr:TetR/AcrR family transcriptional regulator [Aggregatilineales bacterium]
MIDQTKGERTREAILERAVELFNRKGYSGASLSDIMEATGLQKGGIYNHFQSKENLALEAFDYGFKVASDRLVASFKGKRDSIERLNAIIRFFEDYHKSPPWQGGCILLNTAIDSDDTNPALRERARNGMEQWHDMISHIVTKGIQYGQIRANVDAQEVASVLISTLEGAIMLSKLYDDGIHIERAVKYLLTYVESSLRVRP